MEPVKIKENIHWVGAIDYDLRNFHGYLTEEGSTYNSYLIVDDKITLVDTVKENFADEMLERISKIINPAKIDYVVTNHVEMDHSGSLDKVMEVAENATVIISPKGRENLHIDYDEEWNFKTVTTGDQLNIGERNLDFILTPMVHWPDNMVTYSGDDKILFSNDAFGQHFASSERFVDEVSCDIAIKEAKKYYANIVFPYSFQVENVLKKVVDLDIEVIAPSHGLIWRSFITDIVEKYKWWVTKENKEKAVIIYDTMWDSTEKIAYAIQNAFEAKGIDISMKNLDTNHISNIMTDILTAEYVCVGSPTLNNNMLPSVASFLTYLQGLIYGKKTGLAFGSYGWSGESIDHVADLLEKSGFDLLDKIKVNYVPDENTLKEITNGLKKALD
ncbi:FprA family A-type flavoprotein [Selenihalanaerobacter shriftii]|uniref:Flavorubredoxin n=1 Tax=Selenihalanaerobacter shriftii TaxID=142842 RepID=A0A1T4QTL0_9FIRM|nr:FprA family A-type flavoprotein [Selenihalanaerobacter shriftii]SKA06598.1 Flavorubredoxin [Selenihalanaerobacter shriftii]